MVDGLLFEFVNYPINKILIVGAGQIGSRHLQSLCKLDFEVNISVVDNDPISLNNARNRFEEMGSNNKIVFIEFLDSIDKLNGDFNLAIIATNADVRKKVIIELINKVNLNYFLLEKIVFQKIKDFTEVINLFSKLNINTWVNTNRRLYPFYRDIKTNLDNNKNIDMFIDGGNWDMACNGIHFIDLFSFYTDQSEFKADGSYFDKKIIDSKRPGFIEFTGKLIIKTSRGDSLIMNSTEQNKKPISIYISSSNSRYFIIEYIDGDMYSPGKMLFSDKKNNWDWTETKIKVPFLSDLTTEIVTDILLKGKCKLPSINDSFYQHKPFIESMINHLSLVKNQNYEVCPIT